MQCPGCTRCLPRTTHDSTVRERKRMQGRATHQSVRHTSTVEERRDLSRYQALATAHHGHLDVSEVPMGGRQRAQPLKPRVFGEVLGRVLRILNASEQLRLIRP